MTRRDFLRVALGAAASLLVPWRRMAAEAAPRDADWLAEYTLSEGRHDPIVLERPDVWSGNAGWWWVGQSHEIRDDGRGYTATFDLPIRVMESDGEFMLRANVQSYSPGSITFERWDGEQWVPVQPATLIVT